MSEIDRRDMLRGAAALAALAGAAAFAAEEAEAGPRGETRLPKPEQDRTVAPIHIKTVEGSSDIEVSGLLDLTSVELTRDYGSSTHVAFEVGFDTFATGKSIGETAEKVMRLAHIDGEVHRPPVCVVTWGRSLSFRGMVESAGVGYTMFLPDGTPVRATAALRFVIQ